MDVAIIGTGAVGTTFGRTPAGTGRQVTVGSDTRRTTP